MSGPLRTVVIGLNHYHVTGWVETLGLFPDEVEIVGRYDPDPGRSRLDRPTFADPSLPQAFPGWFQNVPFWTDLPAMLRETRPALAMVTLPNMLTPDAVVELACAGCHVIVDKPDARTAKEAERSVEATRSNGVKMAVAFTRRYGHPWQAAASQIERGRLGRILTAEAIFVTSSVSIRNPQNPIFDRISMGGGILHWLGIHDIDLIQWLSGEPIVEVQAMTATMSSSAIDVEDTVSMQLRLAGGAVGTMHFAYALPRKGGSGYLSLRGSDASLRIEANGSTEWIGPGAIAAPLLSETIATETASMPGYGAAGARIVSDMLQAIAHDRDPLATGEDARDALRGVDAAYASAVAGRPVQIDLGQQL